MPIIEANTRASLDTIKALPANIARAPLRGGSHLSTHDHHYGENQLNVKEMPFCDGITLSQFVLLCCCAVVLNTYGLSRFFVFLNTVFNIAALVSQISPPHRPASSNNSVSYLMKD
uniref:Uncharacterized protein n=1 Tax=Glossina austeni TaxID=7395 RepID=A0A1A9VIX2_GLOAU